MMRALHSAGSGMRGQQLNIDNISNNLANVNTTGYKKSRVEFQDLLYRTMREPGALTQDGGVIPTGIQVGHGVRSSATTVDFAQGSPQETNNDLDLAINGEGFFAVELPDLSLAYTRDGSFKIDAEGNLVTSDGYFVLDEGFQPIYIGEETISDLSITQEGLISARFAGEDEHEEIGQLGMTRFVNPAGLEKMGQNLYRATEAAGFPEEGVPGEFGMGTILQGFIEGSNVEIVGEMVDMITAQRAYELNSKAIHTSDEMLQMANNLKR
ncbi:flagellar basal-body rod protein FlgG [Desulfitispora alkaliphila]|uniref:flagellar basal-body rod protein FlgG n=1 Tax=Desulfitispora alkaliphila TaxID=622674 RepID=UPI003D1DE758